MKTIALTGSHPPTLRKAIGTVIAVTGAGLLLHAGLITLVALSTSAAAALSLLTTLLLALAAIALAARMTHAALQAEPVPLALPAARSWR